MTEQLVLQTVLPRIRTTLILLMLVFIGVAQSHATTQAPLPSRDANKAEDQKSSQGVRAANSDDSYVIGANDILAVNVWKEPDISRSVPVRSDGKISLPLVGELQASGQTPRQLEQELSTKLQHFICAPAVT